MLKTSLFLPSTLVDQILKSFEETVQRYLKELNRKGFHIVVTNPFAERNEESLSSAYLWAKNGGILAERSYSTPEQGKWEYPYDGIARGKAHMHWVTGVASCDIQNQYAFLLQEGDPKYWASYGEANLIVAASGLPPHFDLMIDKQVHAECCARSIELRSQYLEKNSDIIFFTKHPNASGCC